MRDFACAAPGVSPQFNPSMSRFGKLREDFGRGGFEMCELLIFDNEIFRGKLLIYYSLFTISKVGISGFFETALPPLRGTWM